MRRPRSRPHRTALSLLAVVGLSLTACADEHPVVAHSGDPKPPLSPVNMLEVLKADSSERYSTLLTCIEQAGLSEALKAPGPLTLFAPDNTQMAIADVRCSEEKLDAGAKKALVRVLTQHVVPADVALTAPEGYDPAKPPRGFVLVSPTGSETVDSLLTDSLSARLEISGKDKTVRHLNAAASATAKLVGDEVRAPNGYIHYIDRVIVPPVADATPPPTTLPKPYE